MADITTRSGKGSPLTNNEVDANFTNLNNDKLETSGGSVTGNVSFSDNAKAIFGAGSDLQIYHDGSNSYIQDVGTGSLIIEGSNLTIRAEDNSRYFVGIDGIGGSSQLYHPDGDALKLATTSTGIDVTGTVTADGLTVATSSAVTAQLGRDGSDGDVLQIYNGAIGSTKALALGVDGTSGTIESQFGNIDIKPGSALAAKFASGGDVSFYEDTGTTPKFFWDASAEALGIGISSPSSKLDVFDANDVTLSIRSTNSTAELLLSGPIPKITLTDTTVSASDGEIKVDTNAMQFAMGGSERLRIDSSGNVGIGTTSPASRLEISNADTTADAAGPIFTITNESQSVTAADIALGEIDFVSNDPSSGATGVGGSLGVFSERAFDGGPANTYLSFSTRSSSTVAEKVRIDSLGRVGIGTTSPSYALHVSKTLTDAYSPTSEPTAAASIYNAGNLSATTTYSALRLEVRSSSGIFQPVFLSAVQNAGTYTPDFTISTRTGSSTYAERLRIDSSGNVGIGTSSPSTELEISASIDPVLRLNNSTNTVTNGADIGEIQFYTNDASVDGVGVKAFVKAVAGSFGANQGSANLTFGTAADNAINASEKMRLDRDGNLLVGKSVTTFSTEGIVAFNSSDANGPRINITNDGGVTLNLNRLTSDGDIAIFYKDGTEVGSIASRSGVVTSVILNPSASIGAGITEANTGSGPSVSPTDGDGAIDDDAIDLGTPTARWQNLYLSGGVYLGGTGAANHLDDYEEGTWTPTTDSDATGAFTSAQGFYRKVGNVVHLFGQLLVSTGFTSNSIGGVPFSVTDAFSISVYGSTGTALSSTGNVGIAIREDTNAVSFFSNMDTDTVHNLAVETYRFQITYMTS